MAIAGNVTYRKGSTYKTYDSAGKLTQERTSKRSGTRGRTTTTTTTSYSYDEQPTKYYDASGREVSAFEVAAYAPMTDFKTGQTVLVKNDVSSTPKTTSSSSSAAFSPLPRTNNNTPAPTVTPKTISAYQEPSFKEKALNVVSNAGTTIRATVVPRLSSTFYEPIKPDLQQAGQTLRNPDFYKFAIGSNPQAVANTIRTADFSLKTFTPIGKGVTAYKTALTSVGTSVAGKTGAVVASGVGTITTSYAAAKTAYEVGVAVQPKSTRELIRSGEAREVYSASAAYASKDLGFVGSYVAGTPVINRVVYPKGSKVYQAQQEYLMGVKADNPSLYSATVSYGKVASASTTAGLVAANTGSELGGQTAFSLDKTYTVTGNAKKIFTQRFVQGVKNIAPQGAFEGFASSVVLDTAEGKRIKEFDYKRAGTFAAYGAVSAGTLGGVISAARPSVSKGLLGTAYASEPFEAVGDYFGSFGHGSVSGGLRGKGVFTFVPTMTSSYTPTTTKTSSSTPSNVFSPTTTTTPSTISSSVSSFTPVPSFSITSSTITSRTTTPTSTSTPSNVFTPTTTPTTTSTPSNVFTPTTTPTTTTTATPPFPVIPFGFGGGRTKGKGFGYGSKGGYTPSAGAILLGIKGKKDSSYRTGLGLRPIVVRG